MGLVAQIPERLNRSSHHRLVGHRFRANGARREYRSDRDSRREALALRTRARAGEVRIHFWGES